MQLAVADDPLTPTESHVLARRLGLPLWAPPASAPGLLLAWVDGRLTLRRPPPERSTGVNVDFTQATTQRRLQGADLLWKAVRGRRRGPLRVIDATAGLGRDAYVLAARGCEVTLFERSAVVAALLADGLARGRDSGAPQVMQSCARMTLRQGSAEENLPDTGPADVVYLDPMFAQRSSHALAKKEMQLLQELLPEVDEQHTLLDAACAVATLRVVVKRPRKAPPLAGRAPAHRVLGRAIRFDIYPR